MNVGSVKYMAAGADDIEEAQADRTQRRSSSGRGVAWIGLLGVIVGGLLTGIPAYVAADKQIDAASSQSNADFHREQQRQAYADFITDEKALVSLEGEFYAALLPSGGHPLHDIPIARYLTQQSIDALPAKQAPIVGAIQKLANDYVVVELVGSSRTATLAEKIIERQRAIANAITAPSNQSLSQRMLFSFGFTPGELGKPDPFAPDSDYQTAEGNVNLTSEAEFLVAARDDLGSN